MKRTAPPPRKLWLATNGLEVFLLRGSRKQADFYVERSQLTVLKSDERELTALVKRGARVTTV